MLTVSSLAGDTLEEFHTSREPSSILLLSSSTVAAASSEGTVIDIFHAGRLVSAIKLNGGFASMHYLASKNTLVITSSFGSVFLVELDQATVDKVKQVATQCQIIQSVLSGNDLFLLHPEGFDKLVLGSELFEHTVEAAETVDTAEETVKEAAIESTKPAQAGAAPPAYPPQDPSILLQQMQTLFIQQATLFETMLVNQQKAEKLRNEQTLQYISDTCVPFQPPSTALTPHTV